VDIFGRNAYYLTTMSGCVLAMQEIEKNTIRINKIKEDNVLEKIKCFSLIEFID